MCWRELPWSSTRRQSCGGDRTFPQQTKASRCLVLPLETQISLRDIWRGSNKNSKFSWTRSRPYLVCSRRGSICCIARPHVPTTSCAWSVLELLRFLPEHTTQGCGSASRTFSALTLTNARRQSETLRACLCVLVVWGCAARCGLGSQRSGPAGQTVSP